MFKSPHLAIFDGLIKRRFCMDKKLVKILCARNKRDFVAAIETPVLTAIS